MDPSGSELGFFRQQTILGALGVASEGWLDAQRLDQVGLSASDFFPVLTAVDHGAWVYEATAARTGRRAPIHPSPDRASGTWI